MRGGGDHAVGSEAPAQPGPSQGSLSERAVPLRRGNRHLRLSERAATEALYISRVRDTTLMHDANREACRAYFSHSLVPLRN